MIIALLGYTDKRPILYSLMKLLQSFGDVLVVSNNRQLQRLLEDKGTLGHFNNVMVTVTDATPDEVFGQIGYTEEDFAHVIYDGFDTLPVNYDICFYCSSYEISEAEKDIISYANNCVHVNMIYSNPRLDGCENIKIDYGTVRSVEMYEAKCLMIPMPNLQLNKLLVKHLGSFLNTPDKALMRVLEKRWDKR